jgi:hypothetical protein
MIEAPVIFEAAHRYVERGFSIVPCDGKKAAIPWAALCERRPTAADVNRWRDMGVLHNVGIIGGAVSGNLALVDLDGDEAVDRFSRAFPSLMETYTVQSGSGHGLHLYLRADILPPSKRTSQPWGNVELRANGCYVVAPPSIHPESGMRYEVVRRVPILRRTSLTLLANWIDEQNAWRRTPRPQANFESQERPAIGEKWALAALSAECAAVRTAPAGSRNHTLNRAAFKLGQLVGAGKLNRSEVALALFSAAAQLVADDGEPSVNRTIESGLAAGINSPRG